MDREIRIDEEAEFLVRAAIRYLIAEIPFGLVVGRARRGSRIIAFGGKIAPSMSFNAPKFGQRSTVIVAVNRGRL